MSLARKTFLGDFWGHPFPCAQCSWLVFSSSGPADVRCFGGALPRRRLVRRVLFSQLHEQPIHRSTTIWWGLPVSHKCVIPSRSSSRAQGIATSHSGAFSALCALLQLVVGTLKFSSMPLSLSVSLPRISLSRSASKIDSLGDDETQLRLTASQTATGLCHHGCL